MPKVGIIKGIFKSTRAGRLLAENKNGYKAYIRKENNKKVITGVIPGRKLPKIIEITETISDSFHKSKKTNLTISYSDFNSTIFHKTIKKEGNKSVYYTIITDNGKIKNFFLTDTATNKNISAQAADNYIKVNHTKHLPDTVENWRKIFRKYINFPDK